MAFWWDQRTAKVAELRGQDAADGRAYLARWAPGNCPGWPTPTTAQLSAFYDGAAADTESGHRPFRARRVEEKRVTATMPRWRQECRAVLRVSQRRQLPADVEKVICSFL